MTVPWLGDACSLVEAFRKGDRSPLEEIEAILKAIESSELNAFTHLEVERSLGAAERADVSLPFGGVGFGVKELAAVAGWPHTEASLVFKDRLWGYDSTMVSRLRAAGGIAVGQTTASEFGGLNSSKSRIHGITRNPWNLEATAGGSSGGSAAAVAGGLLPIATAADGGGSIRIPAGFNGLVGMKGTFGRIPKGPGAEVGALTDTYGCVARSVRDVTRYFDVCAGSDVRDTFSLPKVEGWERNLGTYDLAGKRAVIAPTLGSAILNPKVEELVATSGERLTKDAGLSLVDIPVKLPSVGTEWAILNLAPIRMDLDELYPDRTEDLSPQIAFALQFASQAFSLDMAARAERARIGLNEAMAEIFDQVDFIICATNPDVAFPADVIYNTRVAGQTVGGENNGALTIPANISGNPAISIPVGAIDGFPVGMQVIARRLEDALLLDLALIEERERPWPLVAPGSPR